MEQLLTKYFSQLSLGLGVMFSFIMWMLYSIRERLDRIEKKIDENKSKSK